VPPDVTAGIYWTKNRMPERWRDQENIEHHLGKYIISDRPMSEEEWARERADVIDIEPAGAIEEQAAFGDGREENHLAAGKALLSPASPALPKKSSYTGRENNMAKHISKHWCAL
jgi:hypothetical protein